MKRNIGIAIMALFQALKQLGVNVDVSETDVDTIATGIGGAITAVGVIHDLIRRVKK